MQPQILLINAVIFVRRAVPRLVALTKRLGWKKVSASALVLVLVVALAATRGSEAVPVAETKIRIVTLKTVAELSADVAPLSVVGQVTSKSEATVRAESSGQVIRVNRSLGDSIAAGAVAAEIENASQRAAVLQAQGSVEAAEANLSKITGGARSEQRAILEASVASAEAGLISARSNAVNALLSAHAAADSAISGTTDKMFTTPQLDSAQFVVTSSDSQLTMKIENMRLSVRQYLARQSALSDTLSPSIDMEAEIQKTSEEVRAMRNFVDLIVMNLNKAIATPTASETQIATYLAQATAARTALTGALSSLTGALQSISAAEAGLEIAKKNLELGESGGQEQDVAAARAALKQAQGGLAGAYANLEKTIIRAPIAGTINSFSLKRGDYVQQSTPVLTVANNGALEILTYTTETDAREIVIGQKVTIESSRGVVTRVAPALDPITKKIEVRIAVENNNGLINGQSVLVSIPRTQNTSGQTSRITIPIAALKMESDRVVVFTVEDSKLVAQEVTLGTLLGERVVVIAGLTSEMIIVTDARGLREGEEVEIAEPAARAVSSRGE